SARPGRRSAGHAAEPRERSCVPSIHHRLGEAWSPGGFRDIGLRNELDVHADQHVRLEPRHELLARLLDVRRRRGRADAEHGPIVALTGRMIDDQLEARDERKRARHLVYLRRMHEHTLDLSDGANLADEHDALRRIAARAGPVEQAVHVTGGVADERKRSRPDLRGDELPGAARTDSLSRLRVEELAEEV